MSNEARCKDDKKDRCPVRMPPLVKVSTNLSILEHYLYGKNVVRAIDMQNVQKQRTIDDVCNNNGSTSLQEACEACSSLEEEKCSAHDRLQSLNNLVYTKDHEIGGTIKATYAVMSFPDEVQLCTSSIPGYTYGVCARQNLPSGTWIGPYEGRRTVAQRNDSLENQDYLWEIYGIDGSFSHFIDGSDENSSSWMRFIRCARSKKEQNMAAYQCDQNIYYRSFREIIAGGELLVWYSDCYQKHLEIPMCLKENDQHKIDEYTGIHRERVASATATALQNADRVSSVPKPPQLYPLETATTQGYPEYRSSISSETSFTEIESMSLACDPHTPTVQQTLANHIKKRFDKGQRVENPRNEGKEVSAVAEESKSELQNPVKWDDIQPYTKTNDIKRRNIERYEGGCETNDLCLPFKCRQCLKVFTQRIQLQMHVCPKEPYKPFQCGHCSLSFGQSSELRNHVVVHSSERPFKCGFCGRSFAGATTLNNHIRTHTGERPFICQTCGKTFAIATQLARHTRALGECISQVSRTQGLTENLLEND